MWVGVKYWEIIARDLKKRGWSYGYVSAVDQQQSQSAVTLHRMAAFCVLVRG
jgi:hypothetical protein